MSYSQYSTDKTSLEIKNALLAGKDVLLKLNDQTVGKILYYFCQYDDSEQKYYVRYGCSDMNISAFVEILYNTQEAAKNSEDFLIVQINQGSFIPLDPSGNNSQ